MRTHRPLIGVTLCFAAGIALNSWLAYFFIVAWIAAFLSGLASLILIRRKILSEILLLISFVFLGSLFSHLQQKLPNHHIYLVSRYTRNIPVEIKGIICSDVQDRAFSRTKKLMFTLDTKLIKTDGKWKKTTGKILVHSFSRTEVSYGDYVRLEGKLFKPFNFKTEHGSEFSYRDYLSRRGIKLLFSVKKTALVDVIQKGMGSSVGAASVQLKNNFKKLFREHLSFSEAALMEGIILGDRYHIPRPVTDLFAQTGTAHILAISGQNIVIVAFFLYLVLLTVPIHRKWRYILIIVLLAFYAFLTGSQPSVVRATIMVSVFIASFLTERETDGINSLCLAALTILLINPSNLFDIGFQLSFISVFAIFDFFPKIMRFFSNHFPCFTRPPLFFVAEAFAVSLAAWMGVAGLIAYYFHIITPITILANLPIVPCMTAIIPLGLGLLLVGWMSPWFMSAFAACLKMILNAMVFCVYFFSQCPGSYFYIKNVSLWQVMIYYCLIFLFFHFPQAVKLTKLGKCDKVSAMKNKFILCLCAAFLLAFTTPCLAFWIWTPETNKWVNPKYSVKETPAEQLEYAKGIQAAKDYKVAVNEFEKLIKYYPRSREAAEAQYFIGLCWEEQGRAFDAYKAYQKTIEKYPFNDRSAEIIERQYKIGEQVLEGDVKKSGILNAVVGGDYNVVDVFRTVIKNAPYGVYAAVSQYKIGLYLQEKGLYQEARDEFEKVVNDYPESEWVKAAKYQIALVDAKRSTQAQYDQRVTQAAVKEFEEFTAAYPDAELSEKAKKEIQKLRSKEAENNFLIGRFYEKQKQDDAARIYYEVIINDYHETTWAVKAQERLRLIDLRKK
ncbi:MAG: ComEC/Rec2 family competence protein [Candidatus Omnitrophota bacterium]